MSNRLLTGIISVVVVGIIGIGIWSTQTSRQKKVSRVEQITLGAETSLLSAPVWVAENKGYFEDERLDLKIKSFDSGRLSFLAMLKGEGVDISTVAPTPIMFNSFSRKDFSILASFVYSYDDVKVIARKDKGIRAAEDLKGKKVGTPAGTTGQFFLAAYLTYNGIPTSAVEMIDVKPLALPTALESNQVDAIVIWEPHAYNALQLLQDKAIRLPSSEVYKETFNFMVMKDFAEKYPEALIRFLRANYRAIEFIKNNKEEAQIIVADRLKLNKETMTVLWDEFIFELSLEQSLLMTLDAEARWAIENRLTDATLIPNYLDYIYPEAMKAVESTAVDIIH